MFTLLKIESMYKLTLFFNTCKRQTNPKETLYNNFTCKIKSLYKFKSHKIKSIHKFTILVKSIPFTRSSKEP